MLAGIDVVRKPVVPAEAGTRRDDEGHDPSPDDDGLRQSPERKGVTQGADRSTRLDCPHADCAQPNPPGSTTCAYCNRLLQPSPSLAPQSLVKLPAVLASRFEISRTLPARGAEA